MSSMLPLYKIYQALYWNKETYRELNKVISKLFKFSRKILDNKMYNLLKLYVIYLVLY
jgi:hypothetical protein